MNLKLKLITAFMSSMLIFAPNVMAQSSSSSPSSSSSATKAANQAQRLATLHSRCDSDISQRLTSLNIDLTRIGGLVKLSSDDKNKYSGEIQSDISGLSTLKVKCDSDTDLSSLRADYQSVFTQFRIYAVFLPQLNLLVASDVMGVTADQLNTISSKLQTRIQTAGNPANLTALLSDLNAKVADAKTQYQNVESQITTLTPNSFNTDQNGTKATLQGAGAEIKTGASDLKTAYQDAQQIVQSLKGMHQSPSPQAS